jgi:hypothetical protein
MKMLTPDQNRARRGHINLHKTVKYALTIIIVLTASLFTQACNRKPEEPITTATNNNIANETEHKPSDDNDAVKATDSKPASENDKVIKDDSELEKSISSVSKISANTIFPFIDERLAQKD